MVFFPVLSPSVSLLPCVSVCVFLTWVLLSASGAPGQSPYLFLIISSTAAYKTWLFPHSLPDCSACRSGSNFLGSSVLVMRVISLVLFFPSSLFVTNLLLCLDCLYPTCRPPHSARDFLEAQPSSASQHRPPCLFIPTSSVTKSTLFLIKPLNPAPVSVSAVGSPYKLTKTFTKDLNHPNHKLFCLPDSIQTCTTRDNFIPHVIRQFNSRVLKLSAISLYHYTTFIYCYYLISF